MALPLAQRRQARHPEAWGPRTPMAISPVTVKKQRGRHRKTGVQHGEWHPGGKDQSAVKQRLQGQGTGGKQEVALQNLEAFGSVAVSWLPKLGPL